MNNKLEISDPELNDLIKNEFNRQKCGLEMIASENFTSKSVMQCLGSTLTNKYSEGLPDKRYYGGCEVIDKIETLCKKRALKAFKLDSEIWDVNVQPYSGSPANMAVYTGLLKPNDRIMGLDLPSGGHLTHGYYTSKKKISATSVFFQSLPYKIKKDGYIDYDNLELLADVFKPNLIICGASAYPRDFDYKKFRDIANKNKSFLMCDMSHISGFVASGEFKSPFDFCDVVTSTTHKTLRGPRSGIIFFKKELASKINFAVFPGLQGGPHNHQIAAVANQLLEVDTDEFKNYIKRVKENTKVLADFLIEKGYNLSTNGSDNHLLLLDLRNKEISGSFVEKLCEMVDISINKNSVFGDTSALYPGGIRIGTQALTTRMLSADDIIKVGEYLDEAINLSLDIYKESGKNIDNFINTSNSEDFKEKKSVLKQKINKFAKNFLFYC